MSTKVCIPVEIIRNSKLSPRAIIIWAELSLLPRSEAGEFAIHQKELSNCGIKSMRHRRRRLAILVKDMVACKLLVVKVRYRFCPFTLYENP